MTKLQVVTDINYNIQQLLHKTYHLSISKHYKPEMNYEYVI